MEKEVKKIGVEIEKAVEVMKVNSNTHVPTSPAANEKKSADEQTANIPENKVSKPKEKTEKGKKADAETLQKEIDRKTKELAKCLAELERKKKLSNNRTAFMNALDQLADAEQKLQDTPEFESVLYKLRFTNANSYSSGNDIFCISNTFILSEFVIYMQKRIKEKISEIEAQLIAD